MSNKDTSNESVEPDKDDVIWLNDVKKSREITKEIMRFGVTQTQIKSIISFLALELEDRDLMLEIRNRIEQNESQETHEKKIKLLNPEVDHDE